jgi:predicted oxidoreductase (fatty acid repression mutant protein)
VRIYFGLTCSLFSFDNQPPKSAWQFHASLLGYFFHCVFQYQLGSNSPVPDSEIEKLVHAAILNVPSAFNTQSTRLLVLLHREHERLWDVAIDVFQNLLDTGAIPKEVWERQTLPKLQGFRAGMGTVC